MSAKHMKALRPQTGSYGSVDTGGVVAVTETEAAALLKTRNWVEATADDLKAAREKQDAFVAAGTAFPVGPQFAHVGLSGAAAVESEALQAADERETQLQSALDAALARVGELEAELARAGSIEPTGAAATSSAEDDAEKATGKRPSKPAAKD